MKVREFKHGEVTAFLALIFILLVAFAGSLMESASLQSAKSYRRADANRAIESVFAEYQRELLETFDIFALEGSYESGEYDEQKVLERLSYYGASGMELEIERIQLLTDQNGQAFLEQIARYMEKEYGLSALEGLISGMDNWEGKEEEAGQYQQMETALNQELSGLLSENEVELPVEDNPLPNVQRLTCAPLIELVMPGDRAVSEKSVERSGMPSGRSIRKGYGDFTDVAEKPELSVIAFGEYVLTHFSSSVRKEEEAYGGALDYEVEYILSGKESDRENLERVLKKLLAIRFVPNYAYLQGSAAKRAEAQALAAVLCTAVALPVAAEALTQVLLFAWAFGEGIMDLRALVKGNRVPLTKTDESWQLSLAGLMKLGTGEDEQEGKDTVGGLTYEEYLRGLLCIGSRKDMLFRTLDLIELCLRQEKGLSWFRVDGCISRIEVSCKAGLRRGIAYRFSTYYGYR